MRIPTVATGVIRQHPALALAHICDLFRHAREGKARVARAVVAYNHRAIFELWWSVIHPHVQVGLGYGYLYGLFKVPRCRDWRESGVRSMLSRSPGRPGRAAWWLSLPEGRERSRYIRRGWSHTGWQGANRVSRLILLLILTRKRWQLWCLGKSGLKCCTVQVGHGCGALLWLK